MSNLQAYNTISKEGEGEIVISRSRFVCTAAPAATEGAAMAFVENARQRHRDATHNVWGYIVRAGGAPHERCSDDGEPQGTAGVPVLETLRKAAVQDAVVVVTRYFGGVKLGAGGLIRAYSQGARAALEAAGIVRREPFLRFEITCGYPDFEKLKRAMTNEGFTIKEIAYGENVAMTALSPPDKADALRTLASDITAGKGALTERGAQYC